MHRPAASVDHWCFGEELVVEEDDEVEDVEGGGDGAAETRGLMNSEADSFVPRRLDLDLGIGFSWVSEDEDGRRTGGMDTVEPRVGKTSSSWSGMVPSEE